MRTVAIALLLVTPPSAALDLDTSPLLQTTVLRDSQRYDEGRAGREVLKRIHAGVYDRYTVDLCVDDLARCDSKAFEPYKKKSGDQPTYSVRMSDATWEEFPDAVRFEILQEILFYSWGHRVRKYPALNAGLQGQPDQTPLDRLSPASASMYLSFGRPEYLVGGKGSRAYGPNCWYNSISAIADGRSEYAKSKSLESGAWDAPRFIGPTEFRCHMKQFTEVSEPSFGDLLRYYTEEPVYHGLVFGGEVHGANYVGTTPNRLSPGSSVPIALTKNGRSDLDFLIFQDVRGMDDSYLAEPQEGAPAIRRGFFRVKEGARLLDPAKAGPAADCYGEYQIDLENYRERWACLAGDLGPPAGEGRTCYDYPDTWRIAEDAPEGEQAHHPGAGTKGQVWSDEPSRLIHRDPVPLTAARPMGG